MVDRTGKAKTETNQRAIVLIGMSGSGKTTLARKLAAAGSQMISCDDRIEGKLTAELSAGEHRGIAGVAAWMGWPDQETYRERAERYLQCEKETMEELLREIAHGLERTVVDTTGSVVHTGEAICKMLTSSSTVIYLEAAASERDLLIQRYLKTPKPVLWSEYFAPKTGESRRDTVIRCYPRLIEEREKLYRKYAHHRIPIAALRDASCDAQSFLQMISGEALPPR